MMHHGPSTHRIEALVVLQRALRPLHEHSAAAGGAVGPAKVGV